MIKIIQEFLDKNNLILDNLFCDKINLLNLLEEINNYYNININSKDNISNINELEKKIYNLVNPKSIMFHYFHSDNVPIYGQGSVSSIQLVNLINKVGRHNILDVDVWLEKYKNCELKKNETCITIDDGLKCQYDVALPILKEYNIKAAWYIYTNPINNKFEILDIYKYFCGNYYNNYEEFYEDFYTFLEVNKFNQMKYNFEKEQYLNNFEFFTYNDKLFRYIRDIELTKDEFNNIIYKMINAKNVNVNNLVKNIYISENEIKELSKTQLIGLHSCSHPTRMDLLEKKHQFNEYNDCKDCLEKLINKKINTLSYPCGRYNNDTFQICKQINIKYAFISYLTEIHIENKNLLIQRIDSSDIIKSLFN